MLAQEPASAASASPPAAGATGAAPGTRHPAPSTHQLHVLGVLVAVAHQVDAAPPRARQRRHHHHQLRLGAHLQAKGVRRACGRRPGASQAAALGHAREAAGRRPHWLVPTTPCARWAAAAPTGASISAAAPRRRPAAPSGTAWAHHTRARRRSGSCRGWPSRGTRHCRRPGTQTARWRRRRRPAGGGRLGRGSDPARERWGRPPPAPQAATAS